MMKKSIEFCSKNFNFATKKKRKIRDRQKEEYENLKIEFLTFKKNKLGTQNPDEVKEKFNLMLLNFYRLRKKGKRRNYYQQSNCRE